MAKNPFQTPKFKALFKKWNRILEKDGFPDAEDFTLPDPALKAWHSFGRFKAKDQSETYFDLAQKLLNDGFKFNSDIERRTWELHCNGKSIREIERTLRHTLLNYEGTGRDCVHRILRDIQSRSGIKRG